MAAGFVVWGASCVAFHVSLASDVKQVAYLAGFLVVVGVVTLFADSPEQTGTRGLRWAGVVTTVTLLVALEVALTLNHVERCQRLRRRGDVREPERDRDRALPPCLRRLRLLRR